MVAGFVHLF